ncbi:MULTISPECIES: LysR substrate-binding domain-containing protein [unclassified Xanthobacter]|uniref:LysR substrate-binding domain-containing protein n=1 Tax=unclassified Xanthobacter TaxID=2623496 RepID=UPI001F387A4C
MDLRFLQSLVAVAETGSIAAAARREKLTAAAVSQRVQALERELGCALLARTAHAAQPTQACLALLPRARRLLSEAALLKDDIAGDALAGELSVGAISTMLTGLMPEVLDTLSRTAPGLKLQLVPGSSAHLYELLLRGELDAAILVAPPFLLPKAVACHALRTEPLVLLSREPVGVEEVAASIEAEPFIRYDPSSWGGRLIADYMKARGLYPEVRCDLDALETIALLVARGMGHALVPLWPGLEDAGVHVLPLPDAAAHARRIVCLHAALPPRAPALRALMEALAT